MIKRSRTQIPNPFVNTQQRWDDVDKEFKFSSGNQQVKDMKRQIMFNELGIDVDSQTSDPTAMDEQAFAQIGMQSDLTPWSLTESREDV